MSEKKNKLMDSLASNLPPSVVQNSGNQIVTKDDIQDDYEYSRETYRELIDNSKQSIELMMALAQESEHPRAFEVLSNMLKHSSEMTDKLMDLQKKKRDMTQPKEKKSDGSVTNNNLFVGSTTDLQRFLLSQKQGDVIDVDPEE